MLDSARHASMVYRHYARLVSVAPHGLHGNLLLVTPSNSDTESSDLLVRAANIAGAASLLLISDPPKARERVRDGVCDFLVTNLDEALRILKNELRRRQPVAVCLLADPASVLENCMARGVKPDLLASRHDGLEALASRVLPDPADERSSRLSFSPTGVGSPAIVTWSVPGAARRSLQIIDAWALDLVRTSPERRMWLRSAPQYLSRAVANTHTVPMSHDEAAQLRLCLFAAIEKGDIPMETQAMRGEQDLLLGWRQPL